MKNLRYNSIMCSVSWNPVIRLHTLQEARSVNWDNRIITEQINDVKPEVLFFQLSLGITCFYVFEVFKTYLSESSIEVFPVCIKANSLSESKG